MKYWVVRFARWSMFAAMLGVAGCGRSVEHPADVEEVPMVSPVFEEPEPVIMDSSVERSLERLGAWRVDQPFASVGPTNYVLNTGRVSAPLGASSYSLTAWIKPSGVLARMGDLLKATGGLTTIVGNGAQVNNGYYHQGLPGFWFALNGDHLVHVMSDNESANIAKARSITESVGTVAIGEWSHVAVVVDRADQSVALFINGVRDDAVGSCAMIKTQTSQVPLVVGARTELGDSPFLGSICAVQLYRGVLSEDEVQNLAEMQ